MNQKELFYKSYDKIKKVIIAAAKTEYYSRIFKEIGLDPNKDLMFEDFCRIPIMTKLVYRENKYEMINTTSVTRFDKSKYKSLLDINDKRAYLNSVNMLLKFTSGSTGLPLEIFKSNTDNLKDYVTLCNCRKSLTSYDFSGKFIWIWPTNPVVQQMLWNDNNRQVLLEVNQHGYQFMLYELSESNFRKLYEGIEK